MTKRNPKRKRVFPGTRYNVHIQQRANESNEEEDMEGSVAGSSSFISDIDMPTDMSELATTCDEETDMDPGIASNASSAKLDASQEINQRFEEFESIQCNDIIDLSSLGRLMSDHLCCKHCHGKLKTKVFSRTGLASTFSIQCSNCPAPLTIRNSAKRVYTFESQSTEITKEFDTLNLRLSYAIRTLGGGKAMAQQFCALMNLPAPPANYHQHQSVLSPAVNVVTEECMKVAVEQAIKESDEEHQKHRSLDISADGTWQKRGFQSLNGAVVLASVKTGKILDVETLSKACKCPNNKKKVHLESCKANYQGTSGGMEVEGCVRMFKRSKERYNVEYRSYLGDGDSKAYKELCKVMPYGQDVKIEKLECIGHVQKRMTARMRKLKAADSGTRKLEKEVEKKIEAETSKQQGKKKAKGPVRKSIGGKNRLTDDRIAKLQKYYHRAILQNAGKTVEEMQKSVWATFHHVGSSNDRPNHHSCSPEWCKYIKDPDNYDHSDQRHLHLPSDIMEAIRPVYEALSEESLLSKCLHGKTQNVNECFNHVLWNIVPKNIFVLSETLRLGANIAVGNFNDGNVYNCRVLKELNVEPGHFCVSALKKFDKERIAKSLNDRQSSTKEARSRKQCERTHLESLYLDEEGDEPSYGGGMY